MITVEGLCKTFHVAKRSAGFKAAAKSLFRREYIQIEALKDISFNINEGEVVGYIGPNGAGKSTTIKVMSGILLPDKGKCSIMGRTPWKERIAHVSNIGVVFGQRSQLWWDVPVVDSFELLRDIYKIPQEEYKANLDMLVETLDISSVINNPVRQFIKSMNREKKMTVILTTHDMNDIEALADRILLIGRGRILYDGSLSNLRSRFGTSKTITIDFIEHGKPPKIPGTKLLSWSPERGSLLVDTQDTSVSEVISQLSAQLELLDVTVENPPIEEMIVQLYKEYEI